jgi:hypothetical protein
LAETKLPTLELNTNHIVLNQLNGVIPENCYRSNLTLRNPYDAPTEFSWMPIYGEQGTTFSIRPASGIVEAFKELECEIVWHASYLAPLRGTFSLLVKGGDSVKLTCEAKVGCRFWASGETLSANFNHYSIEAGKHASTIRDKTSKFRQNPIELVNIS